MAVINELAVKATSVPGPPLILRAGNSQKTNSLKYQRLVCKTLPNDHPHLQLHTNHASNSLLEMTDYIQLCK